MSLLILYGTETGTSQDVGESLRREALLRRIHARVVSFEDFPVETLCKEKVVVFVVSTTGQGEIPPNMQQPWRWLLRKNISTDWLEKVHCAVFGLGDSSYAKYNFAGKKLFRRLKQLGANMMVSLGLGDDQHEIGIDGGLVPWKEAFWQYVQENDLFENHILKQFFQGATSDFDPHARLPSKFRIDFDCFPYDEDSTQDYFPMTVAETKRVTAENHFQDTRLVDFEIDDWTKWSYKPGDVLMVRPYNLDETVEVVVKALGYSDELLDRPFTIHPRDPFSKAPPQWLLGARTTLRTCLERYFDLQTIPKKSFFEMLGTLATDPMEKERLIELASPAAIDDLMDYSYRSRRTTAEALRDFPVTAPSIPPEYLFDLFRPIRPRAFSIASAADKQPEKIQLLVAKVEYRSRMATARRGLCSSFISRLQPGDKVFCKLRPGTFRFPSPDKPVVCVGPGTGVAPFRSYLRWRDCNNSVTESVLFFGCRNERKDFYFSDEWPSFSSVKCITAFSRDSPEKIYVQDKMRENADVVWDMIAAGGMVFIAGSAGDMPKAIVAAINDIGEKGGWREGPLADHLEARGRLQFETWS